MWISEEKKTRIRERNMRRRTEGRIEFDTEGAVHSAGFERPTVLPKSISASFFLQRPAILAPLESTTESAGSPHHPEPPRAKASSNSGLWLARKFKGLVNKSTHKSASVDYGIYSDFEGRSLCNCSASVEMF